MWGKVAKEREGQREAREDFWGRGAPSCRPWDVQTEPLSRGRDLSPGENQQSDDELAAGAPWVQCGMKARESEKPELNSGVTQSAVFVKEMCVCGVCVCVSVCC